ncbi:lipoprotein [Streptomyces sp. NPDC057555]|uniref:lipoprotein n=1 Tax=Streptomyces sp. NPDC057555 TaxID=3346166 RepID=UPI00368CB881
MGKRVRRHVSWVLGFGLLAGAAAGSARGEQPSVESIGGPRSVCELPVTFAVPKPWKKDPSQEAVVDVERSRYAPCYLVLGTGKTKVDLYVYVYDKRHGDDPREVLHEFVGYGMSNYGEYERDSHESLLTLARHRAAEMDYEGTPPDHYASFRTRLLSVTGSDATIVLGVGADNPGADERTRRIYDQVKSTIRFAS